MGKRGRGTEDNEDKIDIRVGKNQFIGNLPHPRNFYRPFAPDRRGEAGGWEQQRVVGKGAHSLRSRS